MTASTFQLPSLHGLDWNDMGAVFPAAREALEALTADRWELLLHKLDEVPANPALSEMCETYDFLDKVVLHNDKEHGYRIRAHLFREGYFDRPHDHRWPFASMILTGSYRHTQYGDNSGFADAAPEDLRPLSVRTEHAGNWYALHHTAVHSVSAEEGTLSLVLRGPAVKDSFRIIETDRRSSFTVKGTDQETPEERAAKRMGEERLRTTIETIRSARPKGMSVGAAR
ncbi:hypothetical protein AB0I69_28370 [Streptomyces sp. NPDC050508]|uniref:hypothetical protein n=1 Tax=Streptomyces sp. NPDC050508 TaxID=3155405 RepID=UPI003415F5C7